MKPPSSTLAILLAISSIAVAAEPAVIPERLVVDVVTMKNNDVFRGAVLGRDDASNGLMAVQRDWLQRQHARQFEQLAAEDKDRAIKAAQQLVDRIREWLKRSPEPATLAAFLEIDLERAEARLKSQSSVNKLAEPLQFVVLVLPENRVRTVFVQPAAQRTIAAQAWQERLPNVEQKRGEELRQELVAKRVLPEDPVELWDRLPTLAQGDNEWAARQAIVEFHLGRRVEFQGLGETLIRTGSDAPKLDLAGILPKLLTQQLTDQLGDLLGERRPQRAAELSSEALKPAIAAAESESARGVKVTQLQLDLAGGSASVSTRFLARLPSGKWETVWLHSVVEDGKKARPEIERRIQSDPQLKEALGALRALDAGLDQEITKAVRVGAAVMTAQQATDQQFIAFRDRYSKRLDGPPLILGGDKAIGR